MKAFFLAVCIFFSFFCVFAESEPSRESFKKVARIESQKQKLLSLSNEKSSKSEEVHALQNEIRESIRELESSLHIVDSDDSDFDFIILDDFIVSDDENSYSCSFYFGGEIVFTDKGSLPPDLKKSVKKAAFTYNITSDSEKSSLYLITPRSLTFFDKNGETLLKNEISGKTAFYQHHPAISFDWKSGYVTASEKNVSPSSSSGFGCDAVIPLSFYVENQKFHSIGLEFSLDLIFLRYAFLGGTLGISFQPLDFLMLGLGIFSAIGGGGGGGIGGGGGEVYGTATCRMGLHLPVFQNLTVQPFAEAGCINSRAGAGFGINTALHSSTRWDDHGNGLVLGYSFFRTKGGDIFHKASVGFYFKYESYR